jgi:[protein-PII] uridylyltransferase
MEIFEQFAARRKELAAQFLHDEKAFSYLAAHSEAADRAVLEILRKHALSTRIALCAVGGYGREQLFPFSDLDVLFLLPDDCPEEDLAAIEGILQDFWSLRLNIGSSVRRISECIEQARTDITAQTAMLESRFLFGNRALFEEYGRAMSAALDVKAFFRSKLFEQQQRHIKYGETPYALEPNIKESPGGLRDLNILGWLARAAGLGSTWEEVAASGLLTRHEADLLAHVTEALYRLRIHMHLLSNRHEDRLLFENQERLAQCYGISANLERRPSEILMQRYYLNAKAVVQLNTIILQALKERFPNSIVPTGPKTRKTCGDFVVDGEVLDIAREDLFQTKPEAVLEAFWLPIQDPSISRRSTRLLRALLASHPYIDETLLEKKECRELFLKILQAKRGVYHEIQNMNRWGILGRLLVDFRRIVGQMQHDLFHAYTVDQHTILAIRCLRHFTKSENAHEMPFCTELMMSLKDNWRLVLALLFHDLGKGCGGDHSTIGAEKFLHFARMLNLSAEDTSYIEFLIRHHLLLSRTAQTQDISDPEVVENFARTVGTHDRLVGLYLITVCDIRATSPSVWNNWKAQLLRELFSDAERLMLGEKISPPLLLQTRRAEALKLCRLTEEEGARVRNFWNELDVAYFMRHSAKNIAWHAQTLAPYLADERTFATSRRLAGTANLEFIVLTRDQPELFARIVSFFEYHRLSVLEARIHTTNTGRVLDSFIVVGQGADTPDARLAELGQELTELLENRRPLPPGVTGRLSRRSRTFPIAPKVTLRPDANGKHFLLSIVATDRIGLLSAIAKVFTHFKVYLLTARITTLGERAEDVFIIDAPFLQHAITSSEFEGVLLEALEV